MRIKHTYMDDKLYKKLICYRRELHKYPETGWMEYRTSNMIAGVLETLGFEVFLGKDVCLASKRMGLPSEEQLRFCENRALEEGVSPERMAKMRYGHTGVIGVLRGSTDGDIRAVRFDIDALPINEAETQHGKEYRSIHRDTMHACAHDGHIAAGLGLAEILCKNRDRIKGEIRLIFQPAEEGCRGAAAVVDKGWLDNVDLFLAGHIGMQCRNLGEVAACTSGFLSTTKLNIRFSGVAAHAAKCPENGKNALLAAAVFTQNAYAISRNGKGGTRINIGRFESGNGRNIIADEAYIEAETRGDSPELNGYMREKVICTAKASAAMYGVSCGIDIVGEVGSGKSDRSVIQHMRGAAEAMGISDFYIEDAYFTASEDAVTMMKKVQESGGRAGYFMFGTPLEAEHHQYNFDFDEEVMKVMAEFYSQALLK